VLIPVLLVDFQNSGVFVDALSSRNKKDTTEQSNIKVKVALPSQQKTIIVPLEAYVRGVVAAEMPADFELESLRAQAMAARTYIYSRVKNNQATVTGTVKDQVYATDEMLKKKWGMRYQQNIAKVNTAVGSTNGKIITYQNKPIYAAFFSTSNGYTENSEDYFKQPYPYLRSVSSTWDKQSPKFIRTKTLSKAAIANKLEKYTNEKLSIATLSKAGNIKILKKTIGKRISQIRIGDHVFTGRQIREALGLASSDFSWKQRGSQITFTTYGFGHGVGMSQWGANLMAKQGKTAEEIIAHYYQKVQIKNIKN
jgi:stage II sporulation protein D